MEYGERRGSRKSVNCSFDNSHSGEDYVTSCSFKLRSIALSFFSFLLLSSALLAQTGTVRGKVSDPSGAVIPNAVITAKSGSGQAKSATSGGDGQYQINGLAAGQYTVSASAQGFAPFSKTSVTLVEGRPVILDIPLEIEVVHQNIDVQSEGNNVDTAPANNSNTVVLKDKDLDALSDDTDELQSELQALAGPSAGPNGGQMYLLSPQSGKFALIPTHSPHNLTDSASDALRFLPNRERINITDKFSSTKTTRSSTREIRLLQASLLRRTITQKCTRGTSVGLWARKLHFF
ncbi:MAG: hypothetical protein DMG61_16530 [Acidobacteria bacterium]|nr:MAG: hypothetical protein DMG61_16530 [Acidobacteriota bacterium]